MHPFSCEASVAYRGAVERGKGPEMENWIFTNQETLTSERIRQAARDIAGITDLDHEAILRLPGIRKDTADGGALQINQTPTFYINGVLLPPNQWLNPEFFDLAIQLELKRAGAAAPQKAGGE
jgi:protein-disulfide isomerase